MAPDVLIELIRRPERASMTEAGAYSPDELAEMLTGLNSEDYRDHDKWVGVMMACPDATAGDGRGGVKIGRESWRERVGQNREIEVVGVILKKKNNNKH